MKTIFAILLASALSSPGAAIFRTLGLSMTNVPTGTNINILDEITITMWVWLYPGALSGSAELLNKGRGSNGAWCNYALRCGAGNSLEFYWASPNGTYHGLKSNTTFNNRTNQPLHFAFRHKYGSTNSTMFFINGVRAGVASSFGTVATAAVTNAGMLSLMGYSGGGVSFYPAALHECAIFSRLLTDSEIASLASSRIYLQPHIYGSDLRGYWRFDNRKADFQTEFDSTAGNLNLVPNSAAPAAPSFLSNP